MRPTLFTAALALGPLLAGAQTGDPFELSPGEQWKFPQAVTPDFGLLLEWHQLPAAKATSLLRKHPPGSSDPKLHAASAIEHVHEFAFLRTSPGQCVSLEATSELLAPTDYLRPASIERRAGQTYADGSALATSPAPQAFELFRLGIDLELDPIAIDGGIQLTSALGITGSTGRHRYGENLLQAEQPALDRLSIYSDAPLHFNSVHLLGHNSTTNGSQRNLLFGKTNPLPATGKADPRTAPGLLFETIQAPIGIAKTLLRGDCDFGQGLRRAVAEHIATDQAEVIDASYLIADGRARAYANHDFIYPTHWQPATIEHAGTGDAGDLLTKVTPNRPTAFECRPTGSGFEAKTRPLPGGVQLLLEHDLVQRGEPVSWGKPPNLVRMPHFESWQTGRLPLSISFGEPTLISAFQPRDPAFEGTAILQFITARTTSAKRTTPPDAPTGGVISIEVIETDRALFRRVLAAGSGGRAQLDAAIASGDAIPRHSASIRNSSGQRGRSESFDEIIYPTEFDPETPNPDGYGIFELRPTGLSLQATASATGEGIETTLKVSLTELVRFLPYGRGDWKPDQPLFADTGFVLSAALPPGTDVLAAAVTPRDPDSSAPARDRRLLFFVRAEALD